MDPLFCHQVGSGTQLANLVLSALHQITKDHGKYGHNACLLADIGDYLVTLVSTVAELSHVLTRGTHIKSYSERRFQDMEQDDDFSELSPVDYLSDKLRASRQISTELVALSTRVRDIWRRSPRSCFTQPPGSMPISSSRPPPANSSRGSQHIYDLPSRPSPRFVSSPGIDSTTQYSPPSNMMNMPSAYSGTATTAYQGNSHAPLERRGKVKGWTCPDGKGCRHGGVDKDGNLVVFVQHSQIRLHRDKHEKPFRCRLSNCTRPEGFARKDQLERHQMTVHQR